MISDGIEPVIPFEVVALDPAASSTDVPLNTQLTLTFNRQPFAGAGTVTLRQAGSVTEVFSAATDGVFLGDSVTFTPSAPLNELENYFVLVSSDAFVDAEGTPFPGYSVGTEWAFVSIGPDEVGPVPVTFSPANGTTDAPINLEELSIIFDEPIFIVGDGLIEIRRLDDDVVVEVVSVDEPSAVFPDDANELIVLLLPEIFDYDTVYYVSIPAGSVEDAAGNLNLAFGEPTSDSPWVFTIESEPIPPPSIPLEDGIPYTESFADFTGENLSTGWTAVSSGGVNAYQGDWGSGNAGGFRGGVSDPGVLGYQHNASSDILTVTLNIRNETGETLDELFVSYLGRAERVTQTRSPEWTVKLNGDTIADLAYSTDAGADATVGHLITGLSIADGEVFTLTWESDRGFNDTDSSKHIGLANVFISPEAPVAPPADDFAAWIAGFDVGGLTGPFDTPAGDGVPNILKHVLGLAPDVAVTGSLVTTSEAGPGTLTFVHTRIKPAALATDAVADYEWSTNLADWALDGTPMGGVTVEFGPQTVLDDGHPNFDVVQVTATVTDGTADRLFIRLLADVDTATE